MWLKQIGCLVAICSVMSFAYAVPHNKVLSGPYYPRSKFVKKHKQKKSTIAKKKVKKESPKIIEERARYLEHLRRKILQDRDNPQPKKYWFGHVGLAALLNVDFQNQTKPDFTKANSNKIMLGPSKINLDGKANDWIKGRLGLFYSTEESAYYAASSTDNNIDAEEVYIDVANFKKTPFYLRVGKQYLPFGEYHRYPILRTLTQELTEMRAVAAQGGFVDKSGLYGAAYIFNGVAKVTHPNQDDLNNYGASLGYENYNHPVGFNLGVDFINNMADVGTIHNGLSSKYYTDRAQGISAHLDILSGPFDFVARYVTALQSFDKADFEYKDSSGTHGAKPGAYVVKTGYQFKTIGRESKLVLSYQRSRQAYNTNGNANALKLPKYRVALGYGVSILKHTILAFEYDRDCDYGARNGGTSNYNSIASVRLTVLI